MIIALWLLAIVCANLSIGHFGPQVSILNAFLLIGLSLTTRDHLHRRWDGNRLKLKMGLLIASGGALSWLTQPAVGRIALASVIAFAIAEVVDSIVYHRTRSINKSNVVSGFVDSVLFPTIAFGGFPVLIILGQWVAKVAGGYLWSLVLRSKTWVAILALFGCTATSGQSAYLFQNEHGAYATVDVFVPGKVEVFAFADQYLYGPRVTYGELATYFNTGRVAPTVQAEIGNSDLFPIDEVMLAGVRYRGFEVLLRSDEKVQLTYVWFHRWGNLQLSGYIDVWGDDDWQMIAQPQAWYWLTDWLAVGGEVFISINGDTTIDPALGATINHRW